MKKTYITPQMSAYELVLEGVVAASLKIDSDITVDTTEDGDGGQLTNKHKGPWDASQWSN